MKKVNINSIEEQLGVPIKMNCTSIGFDVAPSATGIAILTTHKASIKIVSLHTIKDDKKDDLNTRMEYFLGELNNYITSVQMQGHKIFVIEKPWCGPNMQTNLILPTFTAITWRELKHLADEPIIWMMATSARSKVGFKKGSRKGKAKPMVRDHINELFGTNITDMNQTDALALALAGLREE